MRPLSIALPLSDARAAAVVYWQVARRAFQRHSTYRGAAFAGVVTNTVFGFLRVYVLLALFRHQASVGSLDATDVVTFTFVTQGLLPSVGVFGWLDLAERIHTGDVATDLYRPVHFLTYWLAHDLGRAAFATLARGLPPVLIGGLCFDLRLPADAATWAAFAACVVLATLVCFGWRFLLTLGGFWLIDNRGLLQLGAFVLQFFAGVIVPLNFFPSGLEHFARLLPFASVVQLPVEVFLGQHAGIAGALPVLAQQALWAMVLLCLGELVTARAFRKVVVQGG